MNVHSLASIRSLYALKFFFAMVLQRVRLLMLDGDVHRSTPLISSNSSSSSHHEEEEDSLDDFQ